MKKKKDDFDVEISVEGEEKSTAVSKEHEEESVSKSKKSGFSDLEEDLAKKEEEIKELNDKLLRAHAEFENFKKRVTKEKSDLLKYANEEMAREMLRTIDNLEMALDHAREDNQSETITEGIEIILKQLLQSLERFGVKGFNAVGERFDPTKHEAVVQVESAEHEPDTVVAESQKGYFLRDRLLRPALVTVSKVPHEEEDE
jgi:molecular chaperone GrpE